MASRRLARLGRPLLATLLCASSAWAEPSESQKEAARAFMAEGRELRDRNDLNGALSRFQTADAIMGVPTTGYEVAVTQAALGQLLEARSTLRAVLAHPARDDEPEPFQAARVKAEALDAELAARLALREQAREVDVAERGSVPVSAAPAPSVQAEPPPAPTQREADASSNIPTLAYAGGGVAVAGLLIGSVTGSMALSKKHAAERGCVDKQCPPATWSDLDSARDLASVSTVSFVLCGVGAAVGVGALLVGRDADPTSASLGIVASPQRIALNGRF